mgnify:CR=1 FL=1
MERAGFGSKEDYEKACQAARIAGWWLIFFGALGLAGLLARWL